MSADNAYFVIERDGTYSVAHGFLSGYNDLYETDLFEHGQKFASRAEALVYAHDRVRSEAIVEYGVIEVAA